MSNFAEELMDEAQSESSAYVQFVTGRGREGFDAYAFVEDSDDIIFYQHILHDLNNISYIGCGGKNGVMSLFKKTKSEGISDGQLFFVDRDTEPLPFEYSDEVQRTKFYSWESHLCQPSAVVRFLQRRIEPSLSKTHCDMVHNLWLETVAKFAEYFAIHTALVEFSAKLTPSLGMKKVSLVRNCVADNGVVLPNVGVILPILDEKRAIAVTRGACPIELGERIERFKEADVLATSRGKQVFGLFREFCDATAKRLGRKLNTDANNISLVLAAFSPMDDGVAYIRRYALGRVVGAQSFEHAA